MGFLCQVCGEATPDRTKEEKITTHVRKVKYPEVRERNGFKVPEGFETVQEIRVCGICSSKDFDIVIVGEEKVVREDYLYD